MGRAWGVSQPGGASSQVFCVVCFRFILLDLRQLQGVVSNPSQWTVSQEECLENGRSIHGLFLLGLSIHHSSPLELPLILTIREGQG